MFQLPAKLHLTLGVMRLFSPQEEVCLVFCLRRQLATDVTVIGFSCTQEKAKELLKECLEKAVLVPMHAVGMQDGTHG